MEMDEVDELDSPRTPTAPSAHQPIDSSSKKRGIRFQPEQIQVLQEHLALHGKTLKGGKAEELASRTGLTPQQVRSWIYGRKPGQVATAAPDASSTSVASAVLIPGLEKNPTLLRSLVKKSKEQLHYLDLSMLGKLILQLGGKPPDPVHRATLSEFYKVPLNIVEELFALLARETSYSGASSTLAEQIASTSTSTQAPAASSVPEYGSAAAPPSTSSNPVANLQPRSQTPIATSSRPQEDTLELIWKHLQELESSAMAEDITLDDLTSPSLHEFAELLLQEPD